MKKHQHFHHKIVTRTEKSWVFGILFYPFNILQSFNDVLLLRNDHVVNLSKGCNPLGVALNACSSGWCFWVSTNLASNTLQTTSSLSVKCLQMMTGKKTNDWGNSTELLGNFHCNSSEGTRIREFTPTEGMKTVTRWEGFVESDTLLRTNTTCSWFLTILNYINQVENQTWSLQQI